MTHRDPAATRRTRRAENRRAHAARAGAGSGIAARPRRRVDRGPALGALGRHALAARYGAGVVRPHRRRLRQRAAVVGRRRAALGAVRQGARRARRAPPRSFGSMPGNATRGRTHWSRRCRPTAWSWRPSSLALGTCIFCSTSPRRTNGKGHRIGRSRRLGRRSPSRPGGSRRRGPLRSSPAEALAEALGRFLLKDPAYPDTWVI